MSRKIHRLGAQTFTPKILGVSPGTTVGKNRRKLVPGEELQDLYQIMGTHRHDTPARLPVSRRI